MKTTLRCVFCILAGSIAAILVISLNGCGGQAQTKQFFDEACKGYKTQTVAKEEPTPEPTPEATPDDTPKQADYDNRCSENDKQQIIADHEARFLRRMAKNEEENAHGPSPAQMQYEMEQMTDECNKQTQCSGLPLQVTIPPGYTHPHCGMMTSGNFVEIQCSKPDEKGLFN